MPLPVAVYRATPLTAEGRLDGFVSVPTLLPGLPDESAWIATV